ncbi:MAG: hypothetical protein VB878_03675 [Pirellulaceae bacterium]
MNLDELVEDPLPHRVALLSRLDDADEETRENICSILESCGPLPVASRGEFVEQLRRTDLSVLPAYWCITLLPRDVGGAVRNEADAIAAHLRSGNPLEVRQRAAWALRRLADVATATRAALEDAANDDNPAVGSRS